MDLVDEEDVAFRKIGQKRRQIARLFNGRAGCDADIHPHFIGDDAGQSGLAKSRRAVEQDVIQRLAAAARRFNIDRQVLLDLFLSVVFAQALRAEGKLTLVLRRVAGCHDGRFKIL